MELIYRLRLIPSYRGLPISRIADVLFQWYSRSRERQALAKLDDRMLQDIGISRSDAESEISKPFWRQ